jgi:CDGSH-type Zn-finger protein
MMSEEQAQAPVAAIKVAPNGPYLVSGGVPLSRRREVLSEHGEPMTWQTTEQVEAGGRYALCRCGESDRKPFCDGTHARAAFDGTETAAATNYDDRSKAYQGTGIEIRDDRSICVHAGFCGTRVTNVWKAVGGGDTSDSIARMAVINAVEKCPSGALTYRMDADAADNEQSLPLAIGIIENGPLWVTGGLPVSRSDDAPMETRNRFTLCRCGQSAIKPLCDGAHRAAGFIG